MSMEVKKESNNSHIKNVASALSGSLQELMKKARLAGQEVKDITKQLGERETALKKAKAEKEAASVREEKLKAQEEIIKAEQEAKLAAKKLKKKLKRLKKQEFRPRFLKSNERKMLNVLQKNRLKLHVAKELNS